MTDFPWWIVWVTLTASLIIVLIVCAIRLVRGFIRLVVAFSELLDKSAILDSVEATRDLVRPLRAVLDDRDAVRSRFEDQMTRRANKRQSRAESRLMRAKIITNVDATQRMWPRAW